MIKVIGHLAPDTDATCAPIAYAWYLSNKKGTPAKAYITGEFNRETGLVLSKFGHETPELLNNLSEGDEYILMDTNNPDEIVQGYENATLVEIIDHHKLAGLKTPAPAKITIRPIACTSTIVWQMMRQDGNLDIPSDIAGILLSAILSDTLKFTSPTTTAEDQQAARELAEMCGLDVDELATEMFDAKSDLTGMSGKDILLSDSKVFELGDKKIRIAVLETTRPKNALDMESELRTAMDELISEEALDGVFFFAVDILHTEATLMVSESMTAVAEKAFSKSFENGSMKLPGVVSRKKQMVPAIEGVI